MQKLGNLDKWKLVQESEAIEFPVARRVRLEVMTPIGTDWAIQRGDDDPEYFTTTSGFDVMEFGVTEPVKLIPMRDVRWFSAGGQIIHIEDTGNESFATVANRQTRNPELEKVAHMAALNATRRMEQMHAEEMRRLELRLEEQGERLDRQTGEILDDGGDTTGEGDGGDVPPEKQGAAETRQDVAGSKASAEPAATEGAESG